MFLERIVNWKVSPHLPSRLLSTHETSVKKCQEWLSCKAGTIDTCSPSVHCLWTSFDRRLLRSSSQRGQGDSKTWKGPDRAAFPRKRNLGTRWENRNFVKNRNVE
jgi:hypothetical protein